MHRKCAAAAVVMLILSLSSRLMATPLGTAFTYQGQLIQGSVPVNGPCDLQAKLFDDETAGSQVGTTQTVSVMVTNGLLTIKQLDFGGSAFTGPARWLEVAARCGTDGGDYTTLGPRQQLNPAPYALYAPSAGSAGALSCTGCVASTQLAPGAAASNLGAGAVDTFRLRDGSVTLDKLAPDARYALAPALAERGLDTSADVGQWNDIAIDRTGVVWISYYDATNGDLRVMLCDDTTCSSTTSAAVDSTGTVGDYTSIGIGADALPLVSYHSTTNNSLKVAHCNDRACASATLTTLDSTGSVGQYTSLAIGADDLGLISYYDATNGDLKVAHCNNAACTSATVHTVDSDGDVGQYTSLAIGADGLALISYYDVTNADLKVVHCSDRACVHVTSSTVERHPLDHHGTWTSIAIGSDGLGLISYYNATNGDLKVAHCENSACTTSSAATIDSDGDVGQRSAIAIGRDGLGRISYYDATNGYLKLALCRDPACRSATISTLDQYTGPPLFPRSAGLWTSIAIDPNGLAIISYADLSANLFLGGTSTHSLNVAANVAANTLTGANITNGSVTGANLATGTVTGANLAAGTVTRDNLAGGCPSESHRYGIWCIDDTVHAATSNHSAAMQTCHNEGKTLCSLTALRMCDIVQGAGACATLTDGGASQDFWTSDVHFGASIFGSVFDNNVIYRGDNNFFVVPEDDSPFTHQYFCCQLTLKP